MKTIKITVLLTLIMGMTSVKPLAQSSDRENANGTPVIYATIDDEVHGYTCMTKGISFPISFIPNSYI